jgi:hypothetical protein
MMPHPLHTLLDNRDLELGVQVRSLAGRSPFGSTQLEVPQAAHAPHLELEWIPYAGGHGWKVRRRPAISQSAGVARGHH